MNSRLVKRFRVTLTVALSTLVVSLLAGSQPSIAYQGQHKPNPEEMQRVVQQAERPEPDRRDAGQAAQDRPRPVNTTREDGRGRLEATTLKLCQKREKNITQRMSRMANRAELRIEVFTKITERVTVFKADKNLAVADYEALVEAVQTKKKAAEAIVKTMREDSAAFKCDGENPRAVGQGFVQAVHAKNAALNDYKAAAKNLIIAVQKEAEKKPQTEVAPEAGQQ